jgi:hypothetical protein
MTPSNAADSTACLLSTPAYALLFCLDLNPILCWYFHLQVLLRALRDFNLGKLTSDDTSIFVGLLNDLFPKTLELVPRAVEKDFESKVGSKARFAGRFVTQ